MNRLIKELFTTSVTFALSTVVLFSQEFNPHELHGCHINANERVYSAQYIQVKSASVKVILMKKDGPPNGLCSATLVNLTNAYGQKKQLLVLARYCYFDDMWWDIEKDEITDSDEIPEIWRFKGQTTLGGQSYPAVFYRDPLGKINFDRGYIWYHTPSIGPIAYVDHRDVRLNENHDTLTLKAYY